MLNSESVTITMMETRKIINIDEMQPSGKREKCEKNHDNVTFQYEGIWHHIAKFAQEMFAASIWNIQSALLVIPVSINPRFNG